MKLNFKKYNFILVAIIALYFGLVFAVDKSYAAGFDTTNGFCQYNYEDAVGGGKDKSRAKDIEIDKTKISFDGIIFGPKKIESCPLPGSSVAGIDGKIGADYMFSSIICVVQAVISDAMFRVYCSILFWAKNAVASAMVLYIMLYGLAIMFDLGNNPVRNAPRNFIKITIIYILATNSTVAYNWLYKSFMVTLNGFTDILAKDIVYDDKGRPVYDADGKLLLDDGRVFDSSSTDIYVSNIYNARAPKQQYYYNPTTLAFEEVFKSRDSCPDFAAEWARQGAKDANGNPLVASDVLYCGHPNMRVVDIVTRTDHKPIRYYKTGSEGCNMDTESKKCRTPFNGAIGKFDTMFKHIVGDSQISGISGLFGAFIGVGVGGGPILSIILLSGILAMIHAFFNMVFTFITALMGVSFLFMLAPVFIPFALFTATFDYFKRWISSLVSFIMQPILVLAFLAFLGSMSGFYNILDMAPETEQQKITTKVGSADFETLGSRFKLSKFKIIDDPYFKVDKGDPLKVDSIANIQQIQKWKAAKASIIIEKYKLNEFVNNSSVLVNDLEYGTLPNFKLEPKFESGTDIRATNTEYIFNGEKIRVGSPEEMYMVYQAKGSPRTLNVMQIDAATGKEKAVSGTYSTSENIAASSFTTGAGTFNVLAKTVPKFDIANKILGHPNITLDDKLITEYSTLGMNKTINNPNYSGLKTMYESEISHDVCDPNRKIFCKQNCPSKVSGKNSAEAGVADQCTNKTDAKEISVFETDKTIIKECKHNCINLLYAGNEKFKDITKDLILFIVLNIVTAAFIGLIPDLCTKLSHLSIGGGGGGGAPALFGGSKRHLASHEYNQHEKSGVYHMGALLNTGLDGDRPGLVVGTLDRIISLSGGKEGSSVSLLKEMLTGKGITGYEEQLQQIGLQKAEEEFNAKLQELANGTEVEKKMAELAQNRDSKSANEDNVPLKDSFLKSEAKNGLYTAPDRMVENLMDRLREEAEELVAREREQAEKK